MSAFTFDTAYIVAHMQASNNECIKAAIRNRLETLQHFRNSGSACNFSNFESYCWAWQNDCLDESGSVWPRFRPDVNCYPYKE